MAHAATSLISFDPNVRPALTPDRAATRQKIESFVAIADVVKVSDEDLSWLYPDDCIDEVAASWRALGPDLLVVTRGSKGAFAISRHGRHTSDPVPTTVADTIGAGDSFTSGLLSALLTACPQAGSARLAALAGGQIDRAIRFAAACARITVSRSGANPPWRKQLPLDGR